MKAAIEIQNLGKQYQLASSERYIALRDVLAGSFKSIFGNKRQKKEKFWVLDNINLSVNPGERLGIIGHNGAGKSTLLKIISRITPPSTGKVTIRGRVGSLLEVGTGFHPELTGRENIFLNGSILGLRRFEINKQLDAIIDFSGVQKFIDTPLKHFSSGMQLRLAFAVAAHLEPEILLIDEVLAVGDLEFQRKCIGKMEEVSRDSGRTIILVSHQLHTLAKLCNRCVWLNKGHIQFDGPPGEAIRQYTESVMAQTVAAYWERKNTNEMTWFRTAEILNPVIGIGENLKIRYTNTDLQGNKQMVVNINIEDEWGNLVAHIINEDAGYQTSGTSGASVTLQQLNIPPGRYSLSLWAGLDMEHSIDYIPRALSFEVTTQNDFTRRISAFPPHSKVIIQSAWQAD